MISQSAQRDISAWHEAPQVYANDILTHAINMVRQCSSYGVELLGSIHDVTRGKLDRMFAQSAKVGESRTNWSQGSANVLNTE